MSRNGDQQSNRSKLSKMFSKMGFVKKGNMEISAAGESAFVIGSPTDVKHSVNVTVNEKGELENIPAAWKLMLEQSKISLDIFNMHL